MKYPINVKVAIFGIVLLVILSKVGCFYLDKKYETYMRPWAFSSDPLKPLLVGKWGGSVIDPDNRIHEVEMEIFLPTTDEDRWNRMSSRQIKHDFSNTTYFDGIAVLKTNGSIDTCELWGGLEKADGFEIHFQLNPINDIHPPGFNLNLLNGTWHENTLNLTVDFAFFKTDGSSFYNSEDPRYDTKGILVLNRITN